MSLRHRIDILSNSSEEFTTDAGGQRCRSPEVSLRVERINTMRRDGSKPRLEIVRVDPAPNPQAQRPFRMLDQVNALVEAREADPDIGFQARLLMLCSLPRTNPGDREKYVRKNGPFTLVMFAGANQKLPFGNLPRLMLEWISTEAVQTQSRELVLGDSLADFMRALGIYSNSGRVHIRLRTQMDRLFQCHVQLVHEHEHGKRSCPHRSPIRGSSGGRSADPTSDRCGKAG